MPPRQIVAELDRYIVGQEAAKKAVAIAVRNRWRRAQAPDDIRDEITPYNIIMIGPTGVGKTEVARRLARLAGAPFIKVEASSSPRWATSAATPSPWCATWWTRPSTWCAPSARTRSIPRPSSGPTSGCSTSCSRRRPRPPAGARRRRRPRGGSLGVRRVGSSGQAKPEKAATAEEERRQRSREKLRADAGRGAARRPRGRDRGHPAELPHDGA